MGFRFEPPGLQEQGGDVALPTLTAGQQLSPGWGWVMDHAAHPCRQIFHL